MTKFKKRNVAVPGAQRIVKLSSLQKVQMSQKDNTSNLFLMTIQGLT